MSRPSREDKLREHEGSLDFLRRLVFGRLLTPGAELKEDDLLDLSKKLRAPHVSRPGIASAISQLVFEGAAIREGNQLKVVYQDDRRQNVLIGARIVTEAVIIDSLCQSLAPDLNQARAINRRLEQLTFAGEKEFAERHAFDFVMQDLEFHLSLADADRSSAARRLITEAYHALVIPLPNPLPLFEHALAITREHEEILKAIASKDRHVAMQSLYSHLSAAVGRWYSSVPRFVDKTLRAVLLVLSSSVTLHPVASLKSASRPAVQRSRERKRTKARAAH